MSMKKKALMATMMLALAAPSVASAQGFAIVEWSAEGVGMSGARMFAENDPAMLAFNPAAITKIDRGAWGVCATYISPHGEYDAVGSAVVGGVKESAYNKVAPGIVPNMFFVQRLNKDEWVGVGAYTRFGMLSKFQPGSMAATSSLEANMQGLSVLSTYARKANDKLSYAVSAGVNAIDLKLYSEGNYVTGDTRLHDAKSYAFEWNAAINYELDDKNELAFVYRSKIDHSVEGKFDAAGSAYFPTLNNADAYGCVTLPDSYTIGYGHKFDDRTRVELQGAYTKWSTYDKLNIDVTPAPGTVIPLHTVKDYSNGWRYAIGIEHKLSDKYSILGGYAYDRAVIPAEHADFMIPTSSLQTFSLGAQYHDEKQKVGLALGYMIVGDQTVYGKTGTTFEEARTRDSYTKIVSVGYQRSF